MTLSWVLYGLTAALSIATMILINKKLLIMGISPMTLNLFLFGLTFVGFFVLTKGTGNSVTVSSSMLILLVCASILAVIGNLSLLTAIKFSPNPGYVSALNASQIILITLLAPLFFKSSLTFPKLAGVLLVVTGVLVISLTK